MNEAKSITARFVTEEMYNASYRSFSQELIAMEYDNKGKIGKPMPAKPAQVEFEFTVVPDSDNVNSLHVEFSVPLDTSLGLETTPPSTPVMVAKSGSKKWDFIFSPFIGKGDTVTVHGFGNKGAAQKVSTYWWRRYFTTVGKKKKSVNFSLNKLGLPLPNRINVVRDVYAAGAFKATKGLIVGVPQPKIQRLYGCVAMMSYSDVANSLHKVRKGIINLHDSAGRGFDRFSDGKPFTGKKTTLPPSLQDNRLFADVVALKVSIAASALGITPEGFGELIFEDTAANTLNGLMLKQIAARADTMMTGYAGRLFESPGIYANLASTIERILSAFEGEMDTVSFARGLELRGAATLAEVPFVKPNPGAQIVRLERDMIETEEPSRFALYQNYPNPFNPTTIIRFELEQSSIVSLRVFNVLGQEISLLLDNIELEGGAQEIEFNGEGLSSGVYFYKITIEPTNEDGERSGAAIMAIKKMMYMR